MIADSKDCDIYSLHLFRFYQKQSSFALSEVYIFYLNLCEIKATTVLAKDQFYSVKSDYGNLGFMAYLI